MPRIYVACLASYNAGCLHGRWIDAAQDPDAIRKEIAEMLKASPEDGAEEYAIHDHEGFGGISVGEYESIDTVVGLAQAIDEHGDAYIAYVENVGTDYATAEGFAESYRGEYDTPEDFAREYVEEVCELDKLPNLLRHHIDYEGIARDFRLGGDFAFVDGDGGVYVFDNH